MRAAYHHLVPSGPIKEWHNLVWFHHGIPKAAFILWLAIKGRLGTQDRLHISTSDPKCLLCYTDLETDSHLLFSCPISLNIWEKVLLRCNDTYHNTPWEEYITWLSSHWKGKALMTTIKKLCFASTVYTIWAERNNRYHTHNSRDVNSIVASILELVLLKLSTLSKIKNNSVNQSTKEAWGLRIIVSFDVSCLLTLYVSHSVLYHLGYARPLYSVFPLYLITFA